MSLRTFATRSCLLLTAWALSACWTEMSGVPEIDSKAAALCGASPNTDPLEHPLPSESLMLWLDATDRGSLVAATGCAPENGEPVMAWRDKRFGSNTTANDATQYSLANARPRWYATVDDANRQPGLRFDGVSSYLEISNLRINSATTIFIVSRAEVQTSNTASIHRPLLAAANDPFGANANGGYGISYLRGNLDGLGVSLGAYAGEQRVSAGVAKDHGVNLHTIRRDGSTTRIFQNHSFDSGDSQIGSGTQTTQWMFGRDEQPAYAVGANPTGNGHTGHSARFYKGHIFEIIIYNRALEAAEQRRVSKYLESKYNLGRRDLPKRDLRLWLDASRRSSLVSAYNGGSVRNGHRVSQWRDLLVTGENTVTDHGSQGSSTRQPVWFERVPAFGHKPAVWFDGSTDVLELPTLNIPDHATIFVVAGDDPQTASAGSIWRPLLAANNNPFRAAGNGYGIALQREGETGFAVVAGNGSVEQKITAEHSLQDGASRIFTVRRNGNQSTEVDLGGGNRRVISGTLSRTGAMHTGYQLGADTSNSARHYRGYIAEILVYGTKLDDEEVARVHGYLHNKYRTPASYDESSPSQLLTDQSRRWHQWRKSFNARPGQPGFPVAAWAFMHRTGDSLEHFTQYRNAGLNMVQLRDVAADLPTASNAGLLSALGIWRNLYDGLDDENHVRYNNDWTGLDDLVRAARDNDRVAAYLLKDEAAHDIWPELGTAHQFLYDHGQGGAIPIATVLPQFAGSPWASRPWDADDPDSYRAHLDDLIATAKPAAIAATTYYLKPGGGEHPGYWSSLAEVRNATRGAGIGMMGFVLNSAHQLVNKDSQELVREYPSPGFEDMSYQVYANLAYGAQGIWFYNYQYIADYKWAKGPNGEVLWGTPKDLNDDGIADVGESLVHTETSPGDSPGVNVSYGYAQTLGCELEALGPTLMGLRSTDVFHGPDRSGTVPDGAVAFDASQSLLDGFYGPSFVVGEFEEADDALEDRLVLLVNKRREADSQDLVDITIPSGYDRAYRYDIDPATCQASMVDIGGPGLKTFLVPTGGAVLVRLEADTGPRVGLVRPVKMTTAWPGVR